MNYEELKTSMGIFILLKMAVTQTAPVLCLFLSNGSSWSRVVF
jgi:hypothetical protein